MYELKSFFVHRKHKSKIFKTYSRVFRLIWNASIQFFFHWSFYWDRMSICETEWLWESDAYSHTHQLFETCNQTRKKVTIIRIYLRPLPCTLPLFLFYTHVYFILRLVLLFSFSVRFQGLFRFNLHVLYPFSLNWPIFVCLFGMILAMHRNKNEFFLFKMNHSVCICVSDVNEATILLQYKIFNFF